MTKRNLFVFCCIYCLSWSLFPLIRNCLPMDTMEAVYWGNYLEWGNYKHPPFSGFVAKFFFDLLGKTDFSLYFLSQVCISIALVYIYRLVKVMVNERRAVQAVYLSTGVLYFNILAVEFNTNVLSVPLWAMNAFYFYQAVRKNKMKHWIVLGITAGLNVLTKYTGGVLLIGMGVYILATQSGRKQLKRIGPYLTCISCIAVLIPHILWLFQYDFLPLRYIVGRGGHENSFLLVHFVQPIKFVLSQIANVVPVILIYFILRFKSKDVLKLSGVQVQFINLVLIFPIVFMAVLGGILGVSMRSMWGTAMMFPVGICFVLLLPIREEVKLEKIMYSLLALLLIVFFLSNEVKVREKVKFDPRKFAQDITEKWQSEFHRPLKYVGGDVFYIAPVSLYSPDHPTPIGDELELNPWLDQQDILHHGGVVVKGCKSKKCDGGCESFSPKQNYSDTMVYQVDLKTLFGKPKTIKVRYCFMKPQGD